MITYSHFNYGENETRGKKKEQMALFFYKQININKTKFSGNST